MLNKLKDFQDVWQRTGLLHKVLVVVVVLVCIGALSALVMWSTKPTMTLLYSNIEAKEAAKIVEKLNDEGVTYELTNGGTTIKVPAERVHSLRLKMAAEGIPSGSEGGYDILDREKLGASPRSQRINYVRAVEGELARSIKLLDGVTDARVHVVQPETNIFDSPGNNATATVVLQVKPGWRLSSANVAAIVNLVAGGVQGLSANNVVVVDAKGELLAGGQDEGGVAGRAGTFLEYKSQVEEYLAREAEKFLADALGPGRATVRVHAEVDVNMTTETIEAYDPDDKVAAMEEITKSQTSPGEGDTGTGSTETTEKSEYLISRTISTKTMVPGEITSISVAAMVDLTAPVPPPVEGEEPPADAPEPEKLMAVADVEALLREALGLDDSDSLKVVETTFQRGLPGIADEQAGGMFSPAFLLQFGRQMSLGILVIGALLVLKKAGKSKKAPAGAEAAALTSGTAGFLPASADASPEMLRVQITKALQENPDEVKRLFTTWIKSGQSESKVS